MKLANEIHNDRYIYLNIDEDSIIKHYTRLLIKCKKCGLIWETPKASHITGKTGCPVCNSSHGEIACSDTLRKLGIEFNPQFSIKSLPKKKFDFFFKYEGKSFLLEFDGMQHFFFSTFFHRDEEEFKLRQEIDSLKQRTASGEGYSFIRIAYCDMDQIEDHILAALELKDEIYYSTPSLYEYMQS